MSVINCFLSCGCEGNISLPAICTDQDASLSPLLSQVCGLLILPCGAQGPSSWVSASAMESIIDNTVTDNSAGKWLVGRGGIDRPGEIIVNTGKIHRQVSQRLYTLTYEINIRDNGAYGFMQTLQRNYTAFTFWMNTRGGRLFGGHSGIKPDFVTAWAEYGEESDDIERGYIELQWRADGDPARTLATVSPSGAAPVSPTPVTNVMFYQQSFPAAATASLAWTENSGVLNSSNEAAQVLVFQNGQKLEDTTQYTISHLSGPSESTITIDASVHFSGANYEVLAIITS